MGRRRSRSRTIAAGRRSKNSGSSLPRLLRVDLLGAEGLDEHAHRVGDADGVGDLDLAALGQAGRDHVLGHPADRVGGRAVDLGRVLAGEGAAAVAGHAAVGVDDDLAARQAGVGVGAAQLEAAGRVDEHPHALGGEALGEDRVDHVLADVGGEQGLDVDVGAVLGGHDHGVQPHRLAALVLHGDLGLAVGAEVGHDPGATDLGQAARQPVGQGDRDRHELGGLVAGVADHHPLVAGALGVERVGVAGALLEGVVDALGDVGRLLVDGHGDPAGGPVEAVLGAVVADAEDGPADHARDVDVGPGGDLPGHHHQAGGDQGLAGHAAGRVVAQDLVQDGVRDLVRDLVRVTLGHRLGREQVPVRHVCASKEVRAAHWAASHRRRVAGPPMRGNRPAHAPAPAAGGPTLSAACGRTPGRPRPAGRGPPWRRSGRRGRTPTSARSCRSGSTRRRTRSSLAANTAQPWGTSEGPGQSLGVGGLVEELGGRRAGAGEPVEADVGEQLVAVDGVLGQLGRRVGPLLELLGDPGQLADRRVGQRVGDRLGPGASGAGGSRGRRPGTGASAPGWPGGRR